MLVKVKRGWELPEHMATPEDVYWNRRQIAKSIAAGPILAGAAPLLMAGQAMAAKGEDPTVGLYPVERNPKYVLDREITAEQDAITYNNFYEFGSHKQISQAAQALKIRPWTVTIDGMVEKKQTLDIDSLLKKMPLEERLYRHRCVEAWSMVIPWIGIPLGAVLKRFEPTSRAKYVSFETLEDHEQMPGQRRRVLGWPYREALRIDEATNPLAILAVGMYGEVLPNQNGAPIRLMVPWKYGFKSIKSIVRIHFSLKQPNTSWNDLAPDEYGFYANVNPEVDHPRWSQARERKLGTYFKRPTLRFNGYGDQVASLYAGMDLRRNF